MDFYDQFCQMCFVSIPHFFHENDIGCTHNTFYQIEYVFATNVETLLGLSVVMQMLKAIHSLIKFAQLRDAFVYDFIATVKICEMDVYHMFCDRQSSFESNVFNNFTTFINIIHQNINLYWITNLNIGIDHLACEFVGTMWATSLDQIGASIFVTKWKCCICEVIMSRSYHSAYC